jgi:hypothetical protein
MKKSTLTYPEHYNTPLFMATTSKIISTEWQMKFDKGSGFGDERRHKSFNWLCERIQDRQSCVINSITKGETERKRAERFINNSHVDISEVIERCCLPVNHNSFAGHDILNIIDQSIITFADAVGRLSGQIDEMGTVANGLHYGQNCVAGLAVRREGFKVLGLSSLLFFSTDANATPSRKRIGRDIRPLEYRDTGKWVKSAHQAHLRAGRANRLIHVIDREGDRLGFLAQALGGEKSRLEDCHAESHVVIRAQKNRVVQCMGDRPKKGKVNELLSQQAPVACYWANVTADERMSFSAEYKGISKGRKVKRVIKRQGRQAMLEIRFLPCQLDEATLRKGTSSISVKQLDELLANSELLNRKLTYIHVKEVNGQGQAIPATKDKATAPINWTILTSLPVECAADALSIVDIYRQRFPLIEQLFRCLKIDGFNIEVAQQQSIKALQIITAIAMKASALVIKMINARDKDEGYAIEDDFTDKEINVLKLSEKQYVGRTLAQANLHPPDQLSWAVWIIARMGGWKPENKKRPPGPKTLQRGLDKFNAIYLGVAMAKGWPIDVSQP